MAPRRVAPALAVAGLALLLVLVPANSAKSLSVTDLRADADWILSAQLPDGAIANYSDRQAVWPYLSNFAALGLVRANRAKGSVKTRRKTASWNPDFLFQVLQLPAPSR